MGMEVREVVMTWDQDAYEHQRRVGGLHDTRCPVCGLNVSAIVTGDDYPHKDLLCVCGAEWTERTA